MAKQDHATGKFCPLIFGEILYDNYPDGTRMLGGAPFNVAWHLRGFGLEPLLLSRVGQDDAGTTALDLMRSWGMETSLIQRDLAHPTGSVNIKLDNGQHSFDIASDQAYDYIDYTAAVDSLRNRPVSLLYHGTLAARSTMSCTTLHFLRDILTGPCFIDINLRSPWWQINEVHGLIHEAAWVKLNEDELHTLTPDLTSITSTPLKFAADHHIKHLLVTRGADGAILVGGNEIHECAAQPAERIVDTVGAGDAFSAVMIYGLSRQWTLQRSLRHAAEFAAAICTLRGAIVNNRTFYEEFINHWED
ncbi:carbohydrate kinase family protein [Sulfurivermis fontis]|uniref:carbohydrate kinase family protein n=1 Tax=Sulfurivermis fontis TaxID=1972068 RepID=UPI000FD73963|nr:carbohydrate kinase [Sulfurivermis fontis]